MKILKVFGIVVGIHVFALILIFANPGCSSTTKPTPADTTANADTTAASSPVVSVPVADSSTATDLGPTPIVPAPMDYSGASVRFTPTRPGSSAATAVQGPKPVTDVIPVSTYTVTRGDSLWSIAKKHHISVADLTAANHIKASAPVHIGQKLIVPDRTPATSAATTAPAATKASESTSSTKAVTGSPTKHVVKSGETLGVIARKYGVKVGDIALANNISDPAKIRPGMELMIPGGGRAPRAAKSSPSASSSGSNASATSTPPPIVTEPAQPLFTPPPADRDLDSGIQPGASDAPVIQIEEPNKK
jgi:LysM repeat protein